MTGEITVFVRIALYALSGYLVKGGWLPEDVAAQFTSPEMVEAVAGFTTGALTLVWYGLSKARKALKEAAS